VNPNGRAVSRRWLVGADCLSASLANSVEESQAVKKRDDKSINQ
jgi:hypothetical protein